MRAHGILLGLALLSLTARAAEHAIVEMECQYPKSEESGTGTARLSFESASKRDYVNVTYVLSTADLERELRQRSGVQYVRVSAEHYVSSGNVYVVRNIERQKGLIDNACDEAISLLLAKVQGREPANILGEPNIELYLLNGIGSRGWYLVHKQVIDKSKDISSHFVEKFYFRSVK
ncbi:MAG: hypothetical protein AMXMBFR84_51310 [Candidatus Hydrogenedentota bacterium]